jgi:chromosome segregation ATPase
MLSKNPGTMKSAVSAVLCHPAKTALVLVLAAAPASAAEPTEHKEAPVGISDVGLAIEGIREGGRATINGLKTVNTLGEILNEGLGGARSASQAALAEEQRRAREAEAELDKKATDIDKAAKERAETLQQEVDGAAKAAKKATDTAKKAKEGAEEAKEKVEEVQEETNCNTLEIAKLQDEKEKLKAELADAKKQAIKDRKRIETLEKEAKAEKRKHDDQTKAFDERLKALEQPKTTPDPKPEGMPDEGDGPNS